MKLSLVSYTCELSPKAKSFFFIFNFLQLITTVVNTFAFTRGCAYHLTNWRLSLQMFVRVLAATQ